MLQRVIDFSLKNKFVVLLATAAAVLGGAYAVKNIPLDAIPDLSDVQVIIYTEWPGQAPQIVQDQVTYPLTTKMLSVPKAKVVRGYSFYGFSFVYVIFEDGTDPYWARSRVLEYLSGLSGRLPQSVTPSLGPDATGVGWAFMYSINSTNRDLAELRSYQDWYLRYQLASVEGVSEVASVGGFVKQYQVTVDPTKLRAYNLSISEVATAIKRSNGEVGGRSIELSEKEFILRVKGYVQNLDDLRKVAVGVGEKGVPILLGQVANVEFGPDMRRGIAELNGEGETVGGIVIVRYGANARQVILDVKKKLDAAMKGLPPDVKYTIAYDRSALIDRAVKTLEEKLLEESIVVALVCLAFLMHLRSAFVAILILPIAVLMSFLVMFGQGISSNIMSLGGIAIAIGAMVDAVIIMIENAHKHMERDQGKKPHWEIIRGAAVEVGPTLFYSLLVITVSFIPVFTLQAQEGRLFKPLAFTKTYSMGAAALLSITLAPILMGFFIRGKIPPEEKNPINRFLVWLYHPVIDFVIKWRWRVVIIAALIVAWVFFPWNRLVVDNLSKLGSSPALRDESAHSNLPESQSRLTSAATWIGKLFPYQNIGSEFMPPLYEGDLLYMPTTFPGISPTKAREVLQTTDKIIRQFPEVHHVFGKIGRAETATDPAPFDMIETTIMLKPEGEWPKVDIKDENGKVIAHRRRIPDELTDAMNAAIQIPGLNNAWTMPIRTRIDMLATGIKTPVGIKIAGPDLAELERVASEVEAVVKGVPGTLSAFAERTMGGNYVQFTIDRDAIARYGLTVGDVQDVLEVALGGMPLTTTVEGLERYAVNLRYSRDFRENLDALRNIVVPTPTGAQVPLGQLAKIETVHAPMGIKSEGAVPNAWIYVDVKGIDIGTYVQMAMRAVNESIAKGAIKLPPGYNIFWSGQYEYMLRAQQRLMIVVPLTLLIILLIIYLNTRSLVKTAIVMLAVPFSLVGAFWIIYLLHYNLSVAVWVGIIALAGLDAETGVVMLLYLDLAYDEWKKKGLMRHAADLRDAIYHGAVKRVRPKAMTACVIIAGLAPILWSHGTGADVMKRIAMPMVGGVVTSTLMELLVYPAIFFLWRSRSLNPAGADKTGGHGDTMSV
jgi:Cu(I)/Ag(I) efflux system membrane protein CusA/SilA